MNTIVVCSMLHESDAINSATRRFRGDAVLAWTMRRLAMCEQVQRVVVLAWDDQLDALGEIDVNARACGPRRPIPRLQAVAAAQRWADGWRGGLLQSAWFDNGFVGELVPDALGDDLAEAAVLVDPAAGLVDAAVIDALVVAARNGSRDFYFTQAAPGLGGVLIKKPLVEKMAAERWSPGLLVHYLPDAPTPDPITSDACVAVPLEVSRVADRFTLDSDRQCRRIERATVPLNGTLISSRAAAVVRRIAGTPFAAEFPRDLTIELTPRRATRPTFAAATHFAIDRVDMPVDVLDALLDQLAEQDDVRVTFAGVGDPLLHRDAATIFGKFAEVAAVSVETDLVDVSDQTLRDLTAANVDVLAVHLPATLAATYQAVMGVDRMSAVLDNVRKLLLLRHERGRGTPVVAPLFTKLIANFDEMELWYDTWLRAIGSAVIVGPSTFGGRIAQTGVADMTPPIRKPCDRLQRRLTILSDGSVVSCEEDPTGRQTLGNVLRDRIEDLWRGPTADLRGQHKTLSSLPILCASCTEWHRP